LRPESIRVAAHAPHLHTLAELHAQESVSKLVWALEDPDREVGEAAYVALKQLTGLDLPRDPSAWQAATHTDPSAAAL